MAELSRGGLLCRAIQTCIDPDDDALGSLGTMFTEDVTVWSPNLIAVGLEDLAEQLASREAAFSDVEIAINSVGVLGNQGFAEFVVSVTFSGPFVVNDEVVVAPNGRQLVLGAAVIADFDGDRIRGLRGYFDDATLLEQMLAEPA